MSLLPRTMPNPDKPAIFDRIVSLIENQIGLPPDFKISKATTFEEIGFDSLDNIEMIMACEDEFRDELKSKEIPEAVMEGFKTVGDVEEYLVKARDAA